jgi:hypothetical protein
MTPTATFGSLATTPADTLRHVVLHRVNSRILAPTLLMHVRYYQTSL